MKILVAVKRVVDFNVKIRVKADHSDIEKTNIKMSMNPFDEIAVEAAISLKEAGIASEVIVVSVGPESAQETVRTGLAMGADRGILINYENELQPLTIAKLLRAITLKENPQMVILGKQSIDGDNNQTGQMLAALLNWGQATFASKVTVEGEKLRVSREIDGGMETLLVKLPAVITTDLRLNQPRYASLPNIMKAKKKPLEILTPADLEVPISHTIVTLKVESPEKRKAGIRVASAAELVEKLRDEGVV